LAEPTLGERAESRGRAGAMTEPTPSSPADPATQQGELISSPPPCREPCQAMTSGSPESPLPEMATATFPSSRPASRSRQATRAYPSSQALATRFSGPGRAGMVRSEGGAELTLRACLSYPRRAGRCNCAGQPPVRRTADPRQGSRASNLRTACAMAGRQRSQAAARSARGAVPHPHRSLPRAVPGRGGSHRGHESRSSGRLL